MMTGSSEDLFHLCVDPTGIRVLLFLARRPWGYAFHLRGGRSLLSFVYDTILVAVVANKLAHRLRLVLLDLQMSSRSPMREFSKRN